MSERWPGDEGGKELCCDCHRELVQRRTSRERQLIGVRTGFVWIDASGSEECPANQYGWHRSLGEEFLEPAIPEGQEQQ